MGASRGGYLGGEMSVLDAIVERTREKRDRTRRILGIIPGQGIGPEVTAASLRVLEAVESVGPLGIERRLCSARELLAPGSPELKDGGVSAVAAEFCRDVFSAAGGGVNGALLCGAVESRFVYDLRQRFDLFCKIAPIVPRPPLRRATHLRPEIVQGVDMLIIRDNAGGVYQGTWSQRYEEVRGKSERVAEHAFSYRQSQVERIMRVAAQLAKVRRGRMDVVIKDSGVPTISALWRDVAQSVSREFDVECGMINADYAAYRIIQEPERFDVLVTPNMIGDMLADLGAVFLGSRGMSFSANYSGAGCGVYQTGHGAAMDLAGSDRANPLAHILTLAMMLRESFDCADGALLVERAVDDVLRAGWRTEDLSGPSSNGCVVGTQRMGELVASAVMAMAANPVAA
jgi:3-isopropylmalate dehydrogenase